MRRAILCCLVAVLTAACAPDPIPTAQRPGEEARPAKTVASAAIGDTRPVEEARLADGVPVRDGVSGGDGVPGGEAVATRDAVAAGAPTTAASARPPSRGKQAGRYDLKLEDAGLPEMTRAISEITGKRFIVSGPLPAIKASLYAPEPVTAEEAYQAFLTILASNGLTVVPRGRMFVIVPSPGLGR